jgi:inorganic triphosphatase YgiF
VKCASVASGGLSTRPEWEQPFTGRFDFSMIEDRPLRQLLERLRRPRQPGEVFETRFERREWRFAAGGGEVLLMADRGTIDAAGRSEAISELEIELAGAPIDALFDLAGRWCSPCRCAPSRAARPSAATI